MLQYLFTLFVFKNELMIFTVQNGLITEQREK